MPLSDTRIRSAKPTDKNYRLHDGRGLYLEIRKTGSKFWRLRIREGGKDTYHTLGQYPGIGLSEARRQAEGIRTGEVDIKSPQKESFKSVADEWYQTKFSGWSENYRNQVRKTLDADILPAIGSIQVDKVTSRDVLNVMNRINDRGAPSIAILCRQWCGSVFAYAITTLRADNDPTQPLSGAVGRPSVKHATALNQGQLKKLLSDINHCKGYRTTVIALKVLSQTMLRTAEVRKGEWTEIDFDRATWTIPGAKMKKKVPHIVPLSSQTVDILKELHTITGSNSLMFPNNRNPKEPMTPTTINTAITRMGWGGVFSGHGFRATASTLLNENGFRSDLIERQLAHASGDRVRASYNHAEWISERRDMLQWWGDYIERLETE